MLSFNPFPGEIPNSLDLWPNQVILTASCYRNKRSDNTGDYLLSTSMWHAVPGGAVNISVPLESFETPELAEARVCAFAEAFKATDVYFQTPAGTRFAKIPTPY